MDRLRQASIRPISASPFAAKSPMSTRAQICPHTGLKWNVEKRSRPSFPPETVASFDVSMHNPRCGGRFLACQLHWAKDLFAEIQFSIGDTLQAHNYVAFGHPTAGPVSREEALALAASEGRRWHADHAAMIEAILGKCRPRYIFWDEWKDHPRFGSAVGFYQDKLLSDPVFRAAMMSDIETFLDRSRIDYELAGEDRIVRATMFLIEEMAVYELHSERDGVVHVYPGKQLKILRALRGQDGIPAPLRNLDYVYLDIRETGADDPEGVVALPVPNESTRGRC
jgi:tRNA-dependent cyclodipeptide synthase